MFLCIFVKNRQRMENRYFARIAALREIMARENWDAVVLTASDPHASEYPAPRWKQVEWLTGFTGEAGDVVVTADHAGLWTDTRYFIQANRQLPGTGVELHKTRVPEQVLIPEWLGRRFPSGSHAPRIAVDGLCMTAQMAGDIRSATPDCEIVAVPNLLDALWIDRPAVPSTPIEMLDAETVGESREHKLLRLREWLRDEAGCDAILLTALDEIAWLLNVRAQDIDYNPYVISYLLVTKDAVQWFADKGGGAAELSGVVVLPYGAVTEALGTLSGRMYADPSSLNLSLLESIPQGVLVSGPSPIPLWKAIKNEVEIAAMRKAHLADGLAMERFLYWLETQIQSGATVNEWEAACKLQSLRAQIPGYKGDSFETISAYGEGAALPHYVTPHGGGATLQPNGLYLVDSGGQYLTGTTDITRTVALGPCSALEKEDYTRVLQGHIALSSAVFPKGTAGCQIDALAREPLWKALRNFGHGTGHGVGFYLGVHEGPQDIRQNFNPQPLLPGMIVSDEPGLYREGMHGVRHENLILCVEAGTSEFGTFLGFEPLTWCHFDTAPLDLSLLTEEERAWLNAYNARVYELLAPHLEPEVAAWLHEKTLPV